MRLSRQDAKRVAREFRRGRGRAWAWLADHDMIIDAEVMDVIRGAWSADDEKPATASEIVAFRAMLVEELFAKGYRV